MDNTMSDKKPKLTQKQAKFVRGIAEGKTNTQSAIDAYDIESKDVVNVAAVIANENLNKPNIQQALEQAMVKLNLTPERALQPIDDALNNEDVKTRLMGSDRALKLMQPKEQQGININFNQIASEQKDKYGI